MCDSITGVTVPWCFVYLSGPNDACDPLDPEVVDRQISPDPFKDHAPEYSWRSDRLKKV